MDDGWESTMLPQSGTSTADHAHAVSTDVANTPAGPSGKKKSRRSTDPASQKRRCVSTACVACRRRKSKCDGALPSCAACSSVYGTECVYDPSSDHRRKGVYREKIDSMKARTSTLQILIEAILNAAEEDVPDIVQRIRTCDSLDAMAESILHQENGDEGIAEKQASDETATDLPLEGERELAGKMGELRLENDSVRFIGGTSHLIYMGDPTDMPTEPESESFMTGQEPVTSWTDVTNDTRLVTHLINMYFTWHYQYFTTLSKKMFYQDFLKGKPTGRRRSTVYCSSLLVNTMLALGCHFTSDPGAFAVPGDSRTKGDHFFAEAKRLIIANDEYEKPRLVTVQALALMSVREAGCAREAKGWVYSGMSFRMAQDIGLNLDSGGITAEKGSINEQEIDARRITFWGCFLFDKCWSNYLGRLPQLPKNSYSVPKYDVFPDEDAEPWCPYTDDGFDRSQEQTSRTRAVGLQMSKLCELSSDVLLFFYHPNHIGRSSGKSVELKKLSELHRRLEEWRQELPKEFEPKDGQLPNVILTHMFFHLQYIHLFRPFLKYTPASSPLPAHVSPRRICTAAAGAISKLMRLYKKTYNLRQICNIAVYMVHSACTIHLLNLPDKTAKRDIIHGVKHLEEIAEDWLCARRTLSILSVLARKWNVEIPDEASVVLQRTDAKYGTFNTWDVPSPNRSGGSLTASPQSYPNSLPATNNEQYSPTNQGNSMTPPPTSQDVQGSGAVSADILNSLGMSATLAGMQSPLHPGVTPPAGTASMTISNTNGLGAANRWGLPAVTQSTPAYTPSYTPSYTPAHSSAMISVPTSQPGTGNRQVSPTSIYAIDGQDWYLKDGANWHQNFESWGLGTAGSGTGADGVGANSPNSTGIPDSSMYLFQGMRGPDMELDPMLESLNGSMGELDRLPGLD